MEYRRARRPAHHRLIGGVAAGLAEHFGVPPAYVRVAFVVATWFNGAGIIGYLLLWRFLPLADDERSVGLESAERRGLRRRTGIGVAEIVQAVAFLCLGAGVLVLMQVTGRGVGGSLFVPILVGLVGVALIWRQIDDALLSQWMRQRTGWASLSRLAAGVALVVAAGLYFLTENRGWGAVLDVGAATGVALIGVTLILGPWISSLLANLGQERRERVRSQERADVAAHLHDSVLQTLALLQKNAGDPAAVATLARRQERELRDWMYGTEKPSHESLAGALRASAADVETSHTLPVELVVVGDTVLDDRADALARAVREAVVNAAKHSGADRVDVFAEIGGGLATVFVRDRGVGFDPAAVDGDRKGLSGSIVERVQRHGGEAEIRSEPGEGTDIRLTMPVGPREGGES